MKKHILGFALFSFIFCSFAVALALFRTQISNVRVFKVPIITNGEKNYCPKKTSQSSAISHEVISSNFFYEEKRIITKVRVSWNRTSPPPEKISVSVAFADGIVYGVSEIVKNPFIESNEEIVTITTDVSSEKPISRKANLYVCTFANESDGSEDARRQNEDTLMTPVVFVHGESSIIKN